MGRFRGKPAWPFLEGLKTAGDGAARREYIRANKPSPDALDFIEELPLLISALEKGGPAVSYVAGQYLAAIALRAGRNPDLRDGLRSALPALAAHFEDPVPPPELNFIPNGYHLLSTGWPAIIYAYLEFARLEMPPEMIPAALRAMDGPNSSGAIEHLCRLKPIPADVIRALLDNFHNPRNARSRWDVIRNLSIAGVNEPDFVSAVIEALSSPDAELRGTAVSAAWYLGPAMLPALPVFERIAAAKEAGWWTAKAIAEALRSNSPTTPGLIPAPEPPKTEEKKPGSESTRVGPYFAYLKTLSAEERRKVLVKDTAQLPFDRVLVPAEDLPILIETLRGDDPDLAGIAAEHLHVMAFLNMTAGTKVRDMIATALPALAAHYDDPSPSLQSQSELKIWHRRVLSFVWMTGAAPPTTLVSKFIAALGDPWNEYFAVQALAHLKPLPAEAFDALLAKMRASGWEVRNQIITALGTNGVGQPAFVAALADYLETSSVETQHAAAQALSQIGAAAKPAESALRRFVAKQVARGTVEAGAQSYARQALDNISGKR